jgi:hypothetical protein
LISNCCQDKANELFLRNRFTDDPFESANFVNYLRKLTKKWGKITSMMAEPFVLKTTGREDFIDAYIEPFNCRNGHERFLVVISSRLYFFVWRVNMLLSDFWVAKDTDSLEAKTFLSSWPSSNLVNEVTDSISIYFGKGDLDSAYFKSFNEILANSALKAFVLYSYAVDLAELFFLFHEFQHYLPSPPGLAANLTIEPDLLVSPERQAKWMQEYKADANAVKILMISVTDIFNKKIGLPLNEAQRTAAQIVFFGADTALHALAVLEKICYGDPSHANAGKSYMYRTHPPAQFRQINLGRYEQAFWVATFGDSSWEEIRKDVSAMIIPREKLFNTFFSSKTDVVNNIRNVLQNG